MNLQDFIKKFTGIANVGDTEANKGECVGLVQEWISNLGTPHVWGHAKDLLTNADQDFYEVILNTPDAIPQAGDIIVWGIKFNGTFGHTAIATGKGDLNTFEVFEQNNPLGSKPHIDNYNYNHVMGWLRPKVKPPVSSDLQAELDKVRKERDENWNKYQAEKTTTTNLNAQLTTVQAESSAKDSQISSLQNQVSTLEASVESLSNQANNTTEIQKALDQCSLDRTSYFAERESLNRTIGQLKRQIDEKKPKGFVNKLIFLLS